MSNKPSTSSVGNQAQMAGEPTDNGAISRSSRCRSDQEAGPGRIHG